MSSSFNPKAGFRGADVKPSRNTDDAENGRIAPAEAEQPGPGVIQVELAQGVFDVAVTASTHCREHRAASGHFKRQFHGHDAQFQAAANPERLKEEGGQNATIPI
jgi:hypothetical protein